jgi:hypothetical protein
MLMNKNVENILDMYSRFLESQELEAIKGYGFFLTCLAVTAGCLAARAGYHTAEVLYKGLDEWLTPKEEEPLMGVEGAQISVGPNTYWSIEGSEQLEFLVYKTVDLDVYWKKQVEKLKSGMKLFAIHISRISEKYEVAERIESVWYYTNRVYQIWYSAVHWVLSNSIMVYHK